MSKKIRPTVFLKAAKIIADDLDDNDIGIPCCIALAIAMGINECDDETLYASSEFKLFKSLYCNGRDSDVYWFGRPTKVSRKVVISPHPENQMKRLLALYNAYEVARTLK